MICAHRLKLVSFKDFQKVSMLELSYKLLTDCTVESLYFELIDTKHCSV